MSAMRALTFFHAPNTRSTGVAILLEELGAPHETRILNMKAGEHRQPAYLAINPMGKVPAILVGDALTTEQVAIYIHLADLFPAAGLAPGLSDPLRGPYLRWIAFYGSSFEPAIVDKALESRARRACRPMAHLTRRSRRWPPNSPKGPIFWAKPSRPPTFSGARR